MTNGCILHLTFIHSKGAPLLQWADTHNLPNLKQQRNVYGDVVLVELGRDGENVLLVVVVPSVLVVRDGELGWERRGGRSGRRTAWRRPWAWGPGQERLQGGEPVQPDGGVAGGLDGVAYGEECHEPNHVEEQKHGAEGLGMPVVVPLAAELWDGELAGSSGRAGGARGLCGARPRCRLAGCRRICE